MSGHICGGPVLPIERVIISALSKVTLIFAIMFTIGLVLDVKIAKKNGKKFTNAKIVALVLLYIIWISMEIFLNMPAGVVVS